MSEHEKKPLSEEELERAAGGEGFSLFSKCWFTPAAGWKKDEHGQAWKQCNSTCMTLVGGGTCICYRNSEICVERWHKVYGDKDALFPAGHANHDKKTPPSYEDNT